MKHADGDGDMRDMVFINCYNSENREDGSSGDMKYVFVVNVVSADFTS